MQDPAGAATIAPAGELFNIPKPSQQAAALPVDCSAMVVARFGLSTKTWFWKITNAKGSDSRGRPLRRLEELGDGSSVLGAASWLLDGLLAHAVPPARDDSYNVDYGRGSFRAERRLTILRRPAVLKVIG